MSGYEKLSGLIIIFEDAKVKSHVGIKIYGPLGLTTNGTAVEGVCVTRRNPPVDCPGCEHGRVPVGRRVWRGICKVGCGWFRDRGK